MQLLDSCPLPQPQYASLSILMQLNNINDIFDDAEEGSSDPKNTSNEESSSTNNDESNDPTPSPNNEPQHQTKFKENNEADKSAGSPLQSNPNFFQQNLQYAVLRESITVLAPTALLPESAQQRSLESLQCFIMEEYGMRDDFIGVGKRSRGPGEADGNRGDGVSSSSVEGGNISNTNTKEGEEKEKDDEDVSRRSSRVRFHDDTKKGAEQDVPASASVTSGGKRRDKSIHGASGADVGSHQQLRMNVYRPPSFHLDCSLGLIMYYVMVHVEDISEWIVGGDGNVAKVESGETNASGQSKNVEGVAVKETNQMEREAIEAFRHCAAVLMPNVTLPLSQNAPNVPFKGIKDLFDDSKPDKINNDGESVNTTEQTQQSKKGKHQKQGGIVLLTIASTGTPYDLFGSSSVIATMPQRLRDGMDTLAKLNTDTKKVVKEPSLLSSDTVDEKNAQQNNSKISSKKKGKIMGKVGQKGKGSGASNTAQGPSSTPQQSVTTEAQNYDSTYFKRLYMALLATLLDDEDGLLMDRDGVPSTGFTESYQPGMAVSPTSMKGSDTSVGTLQTIQTDSVSSSSQQQQMQRVTPSSGGPKVRRKTFTFSRKRSSKTTSITSLFGSSGKSMQDYESGGNIAGGDPLESQKGTSPSAGARSSGDSSHVNPAEIVRRTAQLLEVLSLAEEDMPLPRYGHLGGSGEDSSGGRSSERKRLSALKSPTSGGGPGERSPMAVAMSGRFGRPPMTSDLSGFEYRPPSSPQRFGGYGVAGVSVADDASTMTGDDTATITSKYSMSSSQSSVPMLSRSKRDSATTSNRLRFVQRLKGNKESNAASTPKTTPAEPPSTVVVGADDTEILKPPLFPHERQAQAAQPFDPFGVEDDDYEEEPSSDVAPQIHDTPSATPSYSTPVVGAVSHSYSEDESEGGKSLPESAASAASVTSAASAASNPMIEAEEQLVHLDVDLALNEDLTCEYKKSKLSSISVEGTVQVKVKSTYHEEPKEQQAPLPFFLVFQDHSSHIKALQENKKFVEHVSQEGGIAERDFTYSIAVPREDEYFPVVRYKCSSSLRPVPIRVQSRVRAQGNSCRVALQISSNPQNPSELVHLTIIMGVPNGVRGESLQCNPPGGVWNETKQVVLWCVSELGGGEKFQLQAVFEIEEELLNAESQEDLLQKLEFPVLARCQCSGAQLSDVVLNVSDVPDLFPAEVSMNLVKRFRVSHKEK